MTFGVPAVCQALDTALHEYSSWEPCTVAHPIGKEGLPVGKYHSKMKSGLLFFALVFMVLRASKNFGGLSRYPETIHWQLNLVKGAC